MFLCLHLETNSVHLFNNFFESNLGIIIFSVNPLLFTYRSTQLNFLSRGKFSHTWKFTKTALKIADVSTFQKNDGVHMDPVNNMGKIFLISTFLWELKADEMSCLLSVKSFGLTLDFLKHG